jgi:Cof subfamily protein (haloacid dehalogenase superfamily)
MDGTLLKNDKTLSQYTKSIINRMTDMGIAFTVATARTQASAFKMLEGLKLEIPIILMNGAIIYDTKNSCYVNIEAIPKETAKEVVKIARSHNIDGFLYTISGGCLCSYYERLSTDALKEFHDERVAKYYKVFSRTPDFLEQTRSEDIVYFTFIAQMEELEDLYNMLRGLDGLKVELYRDVYSPELWYLEAFSSKASKRSGIEFLRGRYGFDHITGFGDNLNDSALFEACDEGVAVENAASALKEIATHIIGDNDSDSVMRFISDRESLDLE